MSDTPASHPPPERLAAFRHGHLGDADRTVVEAHLAHCEACRSLAASSPGRAEETAALVPSPPGPEVVQVLAGHLRYRVTELLGVGGMGAVYKALHRLMERTVALKIIKRSLTDNPAAVERFRREVKAAARLAHPNIVTAYDAEQVGDAHFLVMEHVEGTDLARLVKEKGPLPAAQACDYVRQAALGLEHAREKGMVHRDVKPHNLILTLEGQVKILDFGLASLVGAAAGHLTDFGTLMGTPDYIAPEQARDAHRADSRADVYSLGCTLYHLLAGRPPFTGTTPLERVVAHLERSPQPLAEVRSDLPHGLQEVVSRMMAKRPDKRYQTPGEAALTLAPFCPGAVAAPQPVQRRARLRWLVLAVAVLSLLALAGLLLGPALVRYAQGVGVLALVGDDGSFEVHVIGPEQPPVVVSVRPGIEQSLMLVPGDYRVEVHLKDTHRTATRAITLPRGGKEVVRLHDELPPETIAGPSQDRPPFTFRNDRYEAKVEEDGCLTSLRVGGVELLAPGVDFSRGVYLFAEKLGGVLTLPELARPAPDVITARGEHARARYEFGPEAVTFTVENTTDQAVSLFAVLRHEIGALRSPSGRWARAPADRGWGEATFYRDTARLTIQGGKRVWGPWAGDSQVWERQLRPRQKAEVVLTTGRTSPEEAAELAALRAHRDPPEPPASVRPPVALSPHTTPLKGVRSWGLETRSIRARVEAVAFSRDGRYLASAGRDGPIRIWDVANGKLVRILTGHQSGLRSLAWSPTEPAMLASGGWDFTVRVWQADTGQTLRIGYRDADVQSVAWSPDGKTLASAASDNRFHVWDLATNQVREVRPPQSKGMWMVAFAPDGRSLATAAADGTVCLWDAGLHLKKSWVPAPREGPQGPEQVFYLAWSPDGKVLATGTGDQKARLWKMPEATLLRVVEGTTMAYSDDGRLLATGGWTNVVRLWEVATGRLLHTLRGHMDHIYGVAFAPGGKLVASGSIDGSVRLWDAEKGVQVCEVSGTCPRLNRAEWSPDGKTISVGLLGKPQVHFWRPEDGQLKEPLADAFWAVWSPDGKALGSICLDGRARLWEAGNPPRLRALLRGPTPGIWDLAFAPTAPLVATASDDRTVRLWSTATGELKKTLTGHTRLVHGLAWSPDGHYLASASEDGTTRAWDADAGVSPAELGKKYAWKNEPTRVRVLASKP